MSLIVKINNTTELPLIEWDASAFASNPVLKIGSDDLARVKSIFDEISIIQIFQEDRLIGETTQYDTYDAIQYLGSIYSAPHNQFLECLQVNLKKTSLADQVDRLTAKVFPVIDYDAMTTEQYRQWLLDDIEKQCKEDIYAGTGIQISTGTKHFSYSMEDQQNLQSMAALLISVPELPAMPYHADGELCCLMPKADILTVYLTLHMRLLALTTRCNYLNVWIKSMTTKEQMQGISYQSELPAEYQAQVDAILARAIDMEELLRNAYLPVETAGDENENIEEPAD